MPPKILFFITEEGFFRSHFLDRAIAARRAGHEVVVKPLLYGTLAAKPARVPAMAAQILTPHQSQYYAWLLTRRAADEIEAQRNDLIGQLETQLQQQAQEQTLFTIAWELI